MDENVDSQLNGRGLVHLTDKTILIWEDPDAVILKVVLA